ncbi:MAD2L2 [Branchiostoma lanceolatum]|uniref:Mitotic spindle assembly checkpoint protein MAD2B n=1 Tax=Branchiostoma lanceolatum TaxID=7740 RepID=A0A8J9W4L5_BRALA|nr:MAD2L2 [Branchiostoma lanceolatum]
MASSSIHQDINVAQIAADIVCEFLEVAFHQILYIRQVYPAGIFQRRKKYNIPVQMSCHPDVTRYLQDTLQTIRPLVGRGEVDKVVLNVTDRQARPLERFVFEVTPPVQPSVNDDSYLLRLEQALRAFVLKINVCDSMLDTLPQDVTFSVHVYTQDSAAASLEQQQLVQNFPWVEADSDSLKMPNARIIPLKTMTSNVIKMQLYVEEGDKTGR